MQQWKDVPCQKARQLFENQKFDNSSIENLGSGFFGIPGRKGWILRSKFRMQAFWIGSDSDLDGQSWHVFLWLKLYCLISEPWSWTHLIYQIQMITMTWVASIKVVNPGDREIRFWQQNWKRDFIAVKDRGNFHRFSELTKVRRIHASRKMLMQKDRIIKISVLIMGGKKGVMPDWATKALWKKGWIWKQVLLLVSKETGRLTVNFLKRNEGSTIGRPIRRFQFNNHTMRIDLRRAMLSVLRNRQ